MHDVVVAGGGAAGFYAAIHIAEQAPGLKIIILEKSKQVLAKVKISGGGRCNVTHATALATELVANYPRGQKELLGPFYTHGPHDVVSFFSARGIDLKTEKDGRIFPITDSSQTIIDCLVGEAQRLGVQIVTHTPVKQIQQQEQCWKVTTENKQYTAKKLLLTTGSSTKIWEQLQKIGHTIVPPVPSLFTFNCNDKRIEGLQGISQRASVSILPRQTAPRYANLQLKSLPKPEPLLTVEDSVLITHSGLSGPAILKLSAWGARLLHDRGYTFTVQINWTPDYKPGSMKQFLEAVKPDIAKKTVLRIIPVEIPKRLWSRLVKAADIDQAARWGDISKEQLYKLANQLTASSFKIEGKSTFKDEFVTAGGVHLKEIDFKAFQSKLHPNLYFAGEIMDVDAITGGFNFQNAWTGAYIAAKAIATSPDALQH